MAECNGLSDLQLGFNLECQKKFPLDTALLKGTSATLNLHIQALKLNHI